MDDQTLSALKQYQKELQKIETRYKAKRDKEIAKVNAKFGDIELSRDNLAEAYGYGDITDTEYHIALDILEKNGDAKNIAKATKTAASEMLRMIRYDLLNISAEIRDSELERKKR